MARGSRRLGRALIFIGAALWVPELWIVWSLIDAMLTPIRGPGGQLVQVHVHLNLSAWVFGALWTLACWALVGFGVRILLKNRMA
jgi:hypothetical protein